MNFEWDDAKDRANLEKHGLGFDEAIAVFVDPDVVIIEASREEDAEARFKAIGSIDGRLFVVVFTERGESKRIISARRTNRSEERAYDDRQTQT